MKVLFKQEIWEGNKMKGERDLVCFEDTQFVPRIDELVNIEVGDVSEVGTVRSVEYNYTTGSGLKLIDVGERLEAGGNVEDKLNLLIVVTLR